MPVPGSTSTHRPATGRVVPASTYRLQVHGGFGFAQAADQAAYLAALGVTHLYLSPILQAMHGSVHGYDVVDHNQLSAEAGGLPGFDRLVTAARASGLGLVVDVVPNHMAVPTPAHLNGPLWSLLKYGADSSYAPWFDIAWDVDDGRILMPVLGQPLDVVLASGELALAGDGGAARDETVLRYHDHEFPVRPGTEHLDLPDLVAAQGYRLAGWRSGESWLNYRRFFDVTSLIAVRVEKHHVFEATHALLLDLFHEGSLDGFRIDHPDGLADPGGYLAGLAEATGGSWVVAEKILAPGEDLPTDWQCAGTTGYDALLRVQQVLTDPTGGPDLDRLWRRHDPASPDLAAVVTAAKREVVDQKLSAEVDRLVRLVGRLRPEADLVAYRRCLAALLVAMDRYRAYIVPGEPAPPEQVAVLRDAVARARVTLDAADHEVLADLELLLIGEDQKAARGGLAAADGAAAESLAELVVRFQQTCGPVMAKGIEDTAFYRWWRLAGANEVGGHPEELSMSVDAFHVDAAHRLADWPVSMTTLSTHDTKRSEDVRARLSVLAERARDWEPWVLEASRIGARHRGDLVDPPTEYLIWQTLVGTWPIGADRLVDYLVKAVREAATHTGWVDGDAAYEEEVTSFAVALLDDPAVATHLDRWGSDSASSTRATVLAQKLVQLTMPGVPDVYQGTELVTLALVDPDNRGAVDYAERLARLERLDGGAAPTDLDDEKLLVTSRALRLRRDHPQWFVGEDATYAAVPSGSEHVLAFARGDDTGPGAVTVVTRFATRLARHGGWGGARLALPPGRWRDQLSGAVVDGPAAPDEGVLVADVLGTLPVALLVRA
jgi:(1->4)-alpha-D-glucan 1-alpha-D-glucosylmutase